jgi:hypothetical protein
MGALLTELPVHALTAGSAERSRAFTALVQSCVVAGIVANKIAGNIDLSISAARRGYDMVCRQGDPGMIGIGKCLWRRMNHRDTSDSFTSNA